MIERLNPARLTPARLTPAHLTTRIARWRVHVDQAGQSTAEYALVILGAVAIATLLITWATGSHAVSKLFDSVVSKILPG